MTSAPDMDSVRAQRPHALDWLEERKRASGLEVRHVGLGSCRDWYLVDGELRHSSGRYFQIVGTQAAIADRADWRGMMVRQDEIGLLGFLVAELDGEIAWLIQAKTEPGNVGGTQLAPTVQATASNQDQVHGGAPTRYLEWFDRAMRPGRIQSDLLGSEQGSRFLGKRNRNATVMADAGGVRVDDGRWRWLERSVLRDLLRRDFVVNTDARSVIATSPWSLIATDWQPFAARSSADEFESCLSDSYAVAADHETVLEELSVRRASAAEPARELPLEWVAGWRIDGNPVRGGDQVAFVEVQVQDREVDHWHQPLLTSRRTERCDLYAQLRDGVVRFLFRYRAEPGLRNIVELGPTVQTGAGAQTDPWGEPPAGWVRLSVLQSDEGSRFLECVVRYRVIEIPPDAAVDPDDGVWLGLSDIEALVSRSGVFTNEARTTISLLLSLA